MNWQKKFDKRFPKPKGHEWESESGKSSCQLLLHRATGPNGWKMESVREEIKAFIEREISLARTDEAYACNKHTEKAVARVIEFMSHDMKCDNEKQRRAVVKIYKNEYFKDLFVWSSLKGEKSEASASNVKLWNTPNSQGLGVTECSRES